MMNRSVKLMILAVAAALLVCNLSLEAAKRVAYIYGDVAADGSIPSASASAYDQMLLTDSGNTGLSIFRSMVEGEGYTISQHYDATLVFDQSFLEQYDVILFGLHQRVWTVGEQALLDAWIRKGGGILMYSDSAAGGRFDLVGIGNSTGQTAVNSILSNYGMQVAVDQGGGTRSYKASVDTTSPIVYGELVFEGEGVSPVAVDPTGIAEVLIPLDPANRVGGSNLSVGTSGISIANPDWAVIGQATVGAGHVIAIFDRQPLWNNGPGSDIEKADNAEILRRIVRYLARDYGNSTEWLDLELISSDPEDFRVAYRQWLGGTGTDGFDYIARNNRFALYQRGDLQDGDWRMEAGLVDLLTSTPVGDGESERVTLRLFPDANADTWFARVAVEAVEYVALPTVEAGQDQWIQSGGSAWLQATVDNADTVTWSKLSGPGTVSFNNSGLAQTTATVSASGTYELKVVVSNTGGSVEDTLHLTVVDAADVAIAINCGGVAYSGQNGFSYAADVHFDGGGVDAFPGNAVSGTDDDLLYNYARSKNSTFSGYSIPVPNGNYRVLLQFAETFLLQTIVACSTSRLKGNSSLTTLIYTQLLRESGLPMIVCLPQR